MFWINSMRANSDQFVFTHFFEDFENHTLFLIFFLFSYFLSYQFEIWRIFFRLAIYKYSKAVSSLKKKCQNWKHIRVLPFFDHPVVSSKAKVLRACSSNHSMKILVTMGLTGEPMAAPSTCV